MGMPISQPLGIRLSQNNRVQTAHKLWAVFFESLTFGEISPNTVYFSTLLCYNNGEYMQKGGQAVQIIRMRVGDTLELKKPHPCGEKKFRVMRVGSEVRIVCIGCGRDMVLDRVKLEKAIRKLIPAEEPPADKE